MIVLGVKIMSDSYFPFNIYLGFSINFFIKSWFVAKLEKSVLKLSNVILSWSCFCLAGFFFLSFVLLFI